DFANGLFDSCRDVQMPSSKAKAIGVFCGTDANKCTAKKFLTFMGTSSYAPFNINFNLTNNATTDGPNGTYRMIPLNQTVHPCNLPLNNKSSPCSCQDCEAQCSPLPPPIKPPPRWKILGIDGFIFIGSSVFAGFIILFCIWIICSIITGRNNSSMNDAALVSLNGDSVHSTESAEVSPVDENDINCFDKIGVGMECLLETIFTRWGCMCAKYPIYTLVVGFICCAALIVGISLFKVTTNPVELWSSPDSRARQEMNYYEEHFTPFHRTAQIIITAKDPTPWRREDSGSSPTTRMIGAVLKLDILHEVLDLQNRLANITAYDSKHGVDVRLEDICFAPLSPDNNNCTIQSPLNYFQNSMENLDKSIWDDFHFIRYADYMDHFLYCVRDPTAINDTQNPLLNLPCMGTFGGPVMPFVALGEYEDDKYYTANAVIVTFIINNYKKNSTFIDLAMTWEKEYIRILKDYV
ncbi:unnamed protein product, partial [Owenia fusiformis]